MKNGVVNKIPVIVVLGHVDHGKSSLLEKIHNVNITAKEEGGITQHIGGYEIDYQGQKMTFLDTPGHEAFTQMRQRGAKVADVAILVIAADEGLKPQTKEAISILQNTKTPYLVALTKMDKSEANPAKIKEVLAQNNVMVEEWGGTVPCVEVSAKTGKGIPELLETLILLYQVQEIKTDTSKPAKGIVVEGGLDKKIGPICTIILEEGSLKPGDVLLSSSTFGKIRQIRDSKQKILDVLLPGEIATIIGFKEIPSIGDTLVQVKSTFDAEDQLKKQVYKVVTGTTHPHRKLNKPENSINIILKADAQGTLEALVNIIKGMSTKNVEYKVVSQGVGQINDSDVKMADIEAPVAISAGAQGTGAHPYIIIGFRVEASSAAKNLATQKEVKLNIFDVIYNIIDFLRKEEENLFKAKKVRVQKAEMKVIAAFKTSRLTSNKVRQIIGFSITSGSVMKNFEIENVREGRQIGKGRIIELQENKKEVREAKEGNKVAASIEMDEKIQIGDTLIAYNYENAE